MFRVINTYHWYKIWILMKVLGHRDTKKPWVSIFHQFSKDILAHETSFFGTFLEVGPFVPSVQSKSWMKNWYPGFFLCNFFLAFLWYKRFFEFLISYYAKSLLVKACLISPFFSFCKIRSFMFLFHRPIVLCGKQAISMTSNESAYRQPSRRVESGVVVYGVWCILHF